MTKQFATLIGGLIALLIVCICLFEGRMAPAMWQLTGVIWIAYWLKVTQ